MSNTNSVTVRLPQDVANAVKAEAARSGMSVSEVMIEAVASHCGLPKNPKLALGKKVFDHFTATYQPGHFSPDIILEGFQHIQNTPSFRSDYDAAISDPKGGIDRKKRQQVHQHIAKTIKRAVNGTVVQRPVPAAETDLIETYSRLQP